MPAASGASGPISVQSIVCAERELAQPLDVERADRHTRRELGDAGIARRREDLCVRIILSQAPGERVLPPAPAHEQHLHRLRHAELTASLALLKPSLNESTVSRVFWP